MKGGVRVRQAAAVAVAVASMLVSESRLSSAERSLSGRIGPTRPTAVALEPIPEGRSLATVRIGFPRIPVRWRQPGSASDPADLAGLVSAAALPAGTMLGPGSAVPAASRSTAPGHTAESDAGRRTAAAEADPLPSTG